MSRLFTKPFIENHPIELSKNRYDFIDVLEKNNRQKIKKALKNRFDSFHSPLDYLNFLEETIPMMVENRDYNKSNLNSDEVVALVHPFFIETSKIKNSKRGINQFEQIGNYYKRLSDLYNQCKGSDIDLVFFDDYLSYSTISHRLLENNSISDVFLTHIKTNHFIEDDEKRVVDELSGKTIYLGGLFNGMCYTSCLDSLRKSIGNNSQIKILRDFVLDSPMLQYSERENWNLVSEYIVDSYCEMLGFEDEYDKEFVKQNSTTLTDILSEKYN